MEKDKKKTLRVCKKFNSFKELTNFYLFVIN